MTAAHDAGSIPRTYGMPWQLHTTDRLRAEYGDELLCRYAERLEDILSQNALPVPDFPAMIWSQERLT